MELLSDILASMGKKGRELMSINGQLGSDLARLRQEHQGLLEALKAMEQQMVRMMQEHSKCKREFADEVEQKRIENEELRVRLSELESKIEFIHTDYYPGSPRATANRRNSLPVRDGVERHGKLANLQHLPTLEIDESEAHSHNEWPPKSTQRNRCEPAKTWSQPSAQTASPPSPLRTRKPTPQTPMTADCSSPKRSLLRRSSETSRSSRWLQPRPRSQASSPPPRSSPAALRRNPSRLVSSPKASQQGPPLAGRPKRRPAHRISHRSPEKPH